MVSKKDVTNHMLISLGYPEIAAYYPKKGILDFLEEIRSLPHVVSAIHVSASPYEIFLTMKGSKEETLDTYRKIDEKVGKGVMGIFSFPENPDSVVAKSPFGTYSLKEAEKIGKQVRENSKKYKLL